MNPKELFTEVVADLDNLLHVWISESAPPGATDSSLWREFVRHAQYKALRIAGLLRLLLRDETSLLDRVNREYRQRIRFPVMDYQPPASDPMRNFWIVGDRIGPTPGFGTREVSIDQFFRLVVVIVGTTEFTIGDIIRYGAHVRGGVHLRAPNTDDERDLAALDGQLGVRGFPLVLHSLRIIGQVVIDGLQPLAVLVEQDLDS